MLRSSAWDSFHRNVNEKTTYVTLEGLEKAKRDVKEISDRAAGRLAGLPGKNEFLYNIIEMLVNRRN